jgi:outer membrane protein assembly factor BamB
MQSKDNSKLQARNICLLLFCLGIIILGSVCCGYAGRGNATSSPALPSGQCKGDSIAPVAGERTLAVMTQANPTIIMCILRASDGAMLRRYDLIVYGNVVGHGDGLLYVDESAGKGGLFTLCAIHISDGIERWCQPQQNATDAVTAGNGNVYALSDSAAQTLITALSERDGRILWTSSVMAESNPTNHLLMTIGSGAIYTYQNIASTSPTSEVSGACALRASDGQRLWCYPLAGQNITALVADENSLYATSGYSSIYAWNAASGSMRWQQQIVPPLYADEATQLLVAHGMIFTDAFGTDPANSPAELTKLYAARASDGHQLWSVSLKGQIASFAITSEYIYAATAFGDLHALNTLDGKTAWSYEDAPAATPTTYGSKPAADMLVEHNVVYMQSSTGDYTYLLAVNAQNGAVLWKDRSCFSATATPATVVSTRGDGRCYWERNTGQQNLPLNLLQMDN